MDIHKNIGMELVPPKKFKLVPSPRQDLAILLTRMELVLPCILLLQFVEGTV